MKVKGVSNDVLDAGAHVNEFRELVNSIALPTILPVVIDQNDVVEHEALTLHVEKPHAHCTGPKHKTNELKRCPIMYS